MDLEPRSITDQTGELLNQTYLLWRATPLVGFSNKTAHELVQSLRIHLMIDLDYEVSDGAVYNHPEKSTILDIKLSAMRFDDWDKVDESSQALKLELDMLHAKRQLPSKSRIYFLPATLARQSGGITTGVVDYPLILDRTHNKELRASIRRWLQNNFGCNVIDFHVTGSMMKALVNWWTASLENQYDYELDGSNLSTKKCLELTYCTSFTENLDSISFTITVEQLRKMQNLIQGTDLTMMELIQDHVYNQLRIKMDQCILTRVGTPVAYISNTSQLKLLRGGGSKSQYLDFLSELCDLAGTSF